MTPIYSSNDNGAPDGSEHDEASHRPFPLDNVWIDLNEDQMRKDEPLRGRPFWWCLGFMALVALIVGVAL